jgi:hypothetical protein
LKLHLTEAERKVIGCLNDEKFTADYVESWINCEDNFCITATKEAWGFYQAVAKLIERGMVKGVS